MTRKIYKKFSKIWEWIWGNSKEPLKYAKWGEDQPNNGGQGEACTIHAFTDGYAWYDEPCHNIDSRRPLCQFCPPDAEKCQGKYYIFLRYAKTYILHV